MIRRTFLTLLLCLLFAPAFSYAQADNGGGGNNQGNGNGGGNGGGGRGNFDPAQFRQRMEDRLKDELGATDDEWKVIQPKLDKVMDLRFSTMGGMGGRFGRGGRGRDNNDNSSNNAQPQSDNPVVQAMQALRETLDNKNASADEINQKLTAFRDARDKEKKELADAQKDLKDVLTPRQEAVLVMRGMLD